MHGDLPARPAAARPTCGPLARKYIPSRAAIPAGLRASAGRDSCERARCRGCPDRPPALAAKAAERPDRAGSAQSNRTEQSGHPQVRSRAEQSPLTLPRRRPVGSSPGPGARAAVACLPLSVCLPACLSTCVCLSACLSACISTCVCLSVCLPACLPACL